MLDRYVQNIGTSAKSGLSLTHIATGLALLIVVGFGFSLRYTALTDSELPRYPNGDAAKYFLYAYNLSNFGVYGTGDFQVRSPDIDPAIVRESVKPDALVTPGYPLFLSLFLSGEYTEGKRDAILMTQVLLSTAVILLVYLAFAPIGRIYALAIAALTACNPHLVNMNLFFLTEPLFVFFLILFIFLLSLTQSNHKPYFFILLGIALTLASLTRPWIQGYLIVGVLYFLFSTLKIGWRNALLVVAGSAILIAPWMIRNKVTLGYFADPTLSATSIHHGMYPDMMYEGQAETRGYAYRADPMSPQFKGSPDTTLSELKRRAAEQPGEYLSWFLVGKTRTVLSWGIIAGADPIFVYPVGSSPYFSKPSFYLSSYYMERIHGVLMVLALIGTAMVWLPGRVLGQSQNGLVFLRAVSLLVLYFLVMHSIGAPYPRYSIPLRPILYAMALYPLLLAGRFIGQRIVSGIKTN